MNRRDALKSLFTLPMAANTIERRNPTSIQGTAFHGMRHVHPGIDVFCCLCKTEVRAGEWHDCQRTS